MHNSTTTTAAEDQLERDLATIKALKRRQQASLAKAGAGFGSDDEDDVGNLSDGFGEDSMMPAGRHMRGHHYGRRHYSRGGWRYHHRRSHGGYSGRGYYHSGAAFSDDDGADNDDGMDMHAYPAGGHMRGHHNRRRHRRYPYSYPRSGAPFDPHDPRDHPGYGAGPHGPLRHRDDPYAGPYAGPHAGSGYMAAPHEYDNDGYMHDPEGGAMMMRYEDIHTPIEYAEDQVPVKWVTQKYKIRKEFTLKDMTRAGTVISDFGKDFARNKRVQKLIKSGAYLGRVRVTDLVAVGSPASLTVRAESRANPSKGVEAIDLLPPNENFPSVESPQHAGLSKHDYAIGKTTSFMVAHASMPRPTWLSGYPDYNVSNLSKKNVGKSQEPGKLEIATDHPVVHYLAARGLLEYDEDQPYTKISTTDMDEAHEFIANEERKNPKLVAVNSLRLVFGRAYGEYTSAGAPAGTDPTEIADNYAKHQRTNDIYKRRTTSPIVVEGYWEIQHGIPIEPEELELDQQQMQQGHDAVGATGVTSVPDAVATTTAVGSSVNDADVDLDAVMNAEALRLDGQ